MLNVFLFHFSLLCLISFFSKLIYVIMFGAAFMIRSERSLCCWYFQGVDWADVLIMAFNDRAESAASNIPHLAIHDSLQLIAFVASKSSIGKREKRVNRWKTTI